MRLTEHLRLENISTRLRATDKESVLLELAELAVSGSDDGPSVEVVRDAFLAREKLATTGVGSGVAIPHGRFSVSEFTVAIGFARDGLPFDAIDHEPVQVFVAILAPDTEPAAQLRMLARVSRILRPAGFREALLALDDPEQVLRALSAADAELGD